MTSSGNGSFVSGWHPTLMSFYVYRTYNLIAMAGRATIVAVAHDKRIPH